MHPLELRDSCGNLTFLLTRKQGSASALCALGFTKHLKGDFDDAIEMYHQALSRQPDDPFSSEMLNRAFNEAVAIKLVIKSPRPERDIRTPGYPSAERSRGSIHGEYQDTTMASDEDESIDVDMSMT